MDIRKIKRNKPRIAFIIDTWFPVHTGEQVATAELAEALSLEHGYEVDILTRAIKGSKLGETQAFEKNKALRVKRFGWSSRPSNILMTLAYMAWVFFYLLRKGTDYSFYHAQNATSAIPMKMASWFTRVPTVLTVHAHHVFDRTWTLRKIVHRVMFLETKYTQEISISEAFLKATNVNEQVHVIPYGVDTEEFEVLKSSRSPEQFNVLYVGRLDDGKGVDLLLKAAQKVIASNGFIRSHKDFFLHLAGEGPDRKNYESLVEKLGIGKYVRFHGLKAWIDLLQLYKACDLFVMPSRLDALPMAALEAAAARLPLLVSNTGDLRYTVVENGNGHLFEPEDIEELAYYLEYYAGNPHLEKLGDASFNLISQEYSWNKSVEKTLRVYESILQSKARKALTAHNHYHLWEIPRLLLRTPRVKLFKGKGKVLFCFTLNLLPDAEQGELDLLNRTLEWSKHLEIPCTFFVHRELLPALTEVLKDVQKQGHEVGVYLEESDWLTLPIRKLSLRAVQDELDQLGLKNVRFIRTPVEPTEQDLEVIREYGFVSLGTSVDPKLHLEWHFMVPFAHLYHFNLENLLEFEDDKTLEAVQRICGYEKEKGMSPFLIFEANSAEFQSNEQIEHASGENFSHLARKIAFLKEHLELSFRTLSDFCKSCSIR